VRVESRPPADGRDPVVSVVIPTLPGREESLDCALRSLALTCPDAEIVLVYGSGPVGDGWTVGADAARGRYVHLAGDDLEWMPGWWESAARVCDEGRIPAPLVFNGDGSVQSCGDQMDAIVPDGSPATWPRMPFVSAEQWARIGPIPAGIHYFSDNYIGDRGRLLGFETVVCHGYQIVHHLEMTGVGWDIAGGWQERIAADRDAYERIRREGGW
jgi:hypothetical protein